MRISDWSSDVCSSDLGHIYGAWNSEGVFEREYREYRQLGPAQKSSGWNFAVLAGGGVNSVEDLVDKAFVPGAPGSGSASDADLFLKHIGLSDERSEERRVGNRCCRPCRSQGSQ